ncbi:hypothetical protein [Geobacter anodireducens]|uniref:Uncharacterized protein n=1 Tax=Geobacter soli TaxID=1510391 RepID=A0A0C1QNL0_9BACT|nr:hypothetical protein [Geobacter soli]KIE42207.1 hypothetical protein SE37_06010 [Geobacter soli]
MYINELPEIIPPKTIVRLFKYDENTPDWKDDVDNIYCVGYYSRQDGLETLWLVDMKGDYCQTTDKDFLLKYFEILTIGDVEDYYGENSPVIAGISVDEPHVVLEKDSL